MFNTSPSVVSSFSTVPNCMHAQHLVDIIPACCCCFLGYCDNGVCLCACLEEDDLGRWFVQNVLGDQICASFL